VVASWPYGPLEKNITSSTKPEAHIIYRAMATGNKHIKFGEVQTCVSGMIADKHTVTQTHKHVHPNSPLPYQRAE